MKMTIDSIKFITLPDLSDIFWSACNTHECKSCLYHKNGFCTLNYVIGAIRKDYGVKY